MGTIYRSAEYVTVWLGPAADNSDILFDQMKIWKVRLDELKRQCNGRIDMALESISLDDPVFFGPKGSVQQRAVESYSTICRWPWWTRAWIVQEGTASSFGRTALFSGNNVVNWYDLRAVRLFRWYLMNYQGKGLDFHEMTVNNLDVFRESRESGTKIPLLQALRIIRSQHCEDPRDKVCAALGMAMDVNEDDIIPDYMKSFEEVYKHRRRKTLRLERKQSRSRFSGFCVDVCPRYQF